MLSGTLLSDLLCMRGCREFLVWHFVRFTLLLSNLLYCCQFYCACAVVGNFWYVTVLRLTTLLSNFTRLLSILFQSSLIILRYLRRCAVVGSIAQGPLNLRRSFRTITGWHPRYAFRYVSRDVNKASLRLGPQDESSFAIRC